MENVDKLMIITSPNGNEFQQYWGLTNNHSIVKNGYVKPNKVVYGGKIDWKILHNIIDDDGYLVMIHHNQSPRFEERKFKRGDQEIMFFVYYYTTLDESLKNDLWSIDNNYVCQGVDNPTCPFDKLCSDIINGRDTSASVRDVITWVKKRPITTNILDLKLKLLHQCLSLQGLEKAIEEKLHEKIGLEENLLKQLSQRHDPFSEAYLSKLTEIRDKILLDNFK